MKKLVLVFLIMSTNLFAADYMLPGGGLMLDMGNGDYMLPNGQLLLNLD